MKKGEFSTNFLVGMIFSVIVLFLLFIFYNHMIDSGKNIAAQEVCRKSIQFSAIKLKPRGTGIGGTIEHIYNEFSDPFGNAVKLDCATEYINYQGNKPEFVKKVIADKMVDCWSQFGEGKKELFDTEDQTYCVVCSRLTFDEDVEVNHFSLYLTENWGPNEGESYWKYFNGIVVEDFEETHYENSDLNKFDSFVTDFPIAVIYLMGKDANPGAFGDVEEGKTVETIKMGSLATVGGVVAGLTLCATGIGCAVTAVVGLGVLGGGIGATSGYIIGSDRSADWDARILLWNYNDMRELPCTRMESKSTPLRIIQEDINT